MMSYSRWHKKYKNAVVAVIKRVKGGQNCQHFVLFLKLTFRVRNLETISLFKELISNIKELYKVSTIFLPCNLKFKYDIFNQKLTLFR